MHSLTIWRNVSIGAGLVILVLGGVFATFEVVGSVQTLDKAEAIRAEQERMASWLDETLANLEEINEELGYLTGRVAAARATLESAESEIYYWTRVIGRSDSGGLYWMRDQALDVLSALENSHRTLTFEQEATVQLIAEQVRGSAALESYRVAIELQRAEHESRAWLIGAACIVGVVVSLGFTLSLSLAAGRARLALDVA